MLTQAADFAPVPERTSPSDAACAAARPGADDSPASVRGRIRIALPEMRSGSGLLLSLFPRQVVCVSLACFLVSSLRSGHPLFFMRAIRSGFYFLRLKAYFCLREPCGRGWPGHTFHRTMSHLQLLARSVQEHSRCWGSIGGSRRCDRWPGPSDG